MKFYYSSSSDQLFISDQKMKLQKSGKPVIESIDGFLCSLKSS